MNYDANLSKVAKIPIPEEKIPKDLRKEGQDYFILSGIISEDRKGRFPDGMRIYTSLIQEISGDLAKTLNTTYQITSWQK